MKLIKTAEVLAFEYGEQFNGKETSKNDVNIAWYAGYEAAKEHAHHALEEQEATHQQYIDKAEANFKELEAKVRNLKSHFDYVLAENNHLKEVIQELEEEGRG